MFFRACEYKYKSKETSFGDKVILKAFLSTFLYSNKYDKMSCAELSYVSKHDIDWEEVLDKNFIRGHFNIKV